MIAVGSDDSSSSGGGKVHIYEYSDNTRWVRGRGESEVMIDAMSLYFIEITCDITMW